MALPDGFRDRTSPSYRDRKASRLLTENRSLSTSANHSDSSGLARSLALSFSRVAAARRIPVLPHVLQRNSGFLAHARHARGNDRKIRTICCREAVNPYEARVLTRWCLLSISSSGRTASLPTNPLCNE